MPNNSLPWPVLRALGPTAPAGLAIASVPIPRGQDWRLGYPGDPSQAVPLAWYPGEDGPGDVRQALVLGLLPEAQAAPATLELANDPAAAAILAASNPQTLPAPDGWPGPTWDLTIISKKKTGILMREVNELVVRHQQREVGLRMGIRTGDGLKWWQYVRIEPLWSGPICRAFRAAGYIGIRDLDDSVLASNGRYNSGYWLHRHNWLLAELYILVFANGLLRITARHINNRSFDKGEDLHDVLPVLGLRAPAGQAIPAAGLDLDGSQRDFDLGSAHLDIARSNDLRSPGHTGRLEREADVVVFQPYTGAEITFGPGEPPELFELKARERRIWAGMARSFGFDLSLASQPIRTQRYWPPYGWTVHCGVLWPDGASALPARGPMEPILDKWLEKFEQAHGGMQSGRYMQQSSLWDGEYAHGLMCQAYRSGRADFFHGALHHAYAMADNGVDHIDFTARIWYMKQDSTGQVLQRILGVLTAYLEEGDPYLLRVSESLADAAYAMDRSNWPRRSYGRDGAYIRSLTRLFDVTGDRHFLRRAGECCRRAAQCQLPNGAFADQGGCAEAHGHLNDIVKPWMNAILTEAMVDYLERAGSDAPVEQAVIRCGDWLLSQLLEDADGKYWPYEVAWGENDGPPYHMILPDRPQAKHPTGEVQLDYLARVMLWISRKTGQAKYGQAWQDTYQRQYIRKGKISSSYGEVKSAENMPWHEAHLWNASWSDGQVTVKPLLDLLEVGRSATIELPDGSQSQVTRTASGVEITAAAAAGGRPLDGRLASR